MTAIPTPDPASYPAVDTPARLLLGPGPSMVHPRVTRAMTTPVVGYMDPLFLDVLTRTAELLRYTFQTTNRLTLTVSGTGTAGMEAAIANIVEPGDAVLVCAKGYFGLRLAEMARRYGANVEVITRPWGEAFTPSEVSDALKRRKAKVVGIVHAETSTGVCQPLDEIARIVHDQGGLLIVDAVTSLGGVPLMVDELGIDVCYSGTQKCLGCPPGLGLITVGPRAEEKLTARKSTVPNFFLDLTLLQKYWGSEHAYHHTASMPMHYGFYEGLRMVVEEGLENRWARHRKNAESLWKGLADLDLTLHVPEDVRLATLTTVRVPDGVDEAKVRQRLMQEYNIEIGAGLGDLKGKVWRIGLMGYSSREENVLLLLAALEKLLH
jgi:alanine-glyoxylate transaminase/serine-glyoxylate transaminase/serine-pyruvate transaminase